MRNSIIAVTNLMFVVHTVFGCCLHHTHGADGEQHFHHHATTVDDDDCHSESHEPADEDCPLLPCREDYCSYVKCDSQRIDSSPTLALRTPLAVADKHLSTHTLALTALSQAALFRPPDTPLHLLYCALVV
jgi:hypothetical protein